MKAEEIKLFMGARDITLEMDQAERLAVFYDLLVKHNDEMDLTRIRGKEDILTRHFLDSIIVAEYVQIPESLLDIGTGAGFPGIPLSIMVPETHVILAEPRPRRVEFMKMVIEKLDLSGIEIYPHLVGEHSFFDVKGVITRALEKSGETLERVYHFLDEGARVMLMKGPEVDREGYLDSAHAGYRFLKDFAYSLHKTEHKRRLLVYEKNTDFRKRTFVIPRKGIPAPGIHIESGENRQFRSLRRSAEGQNLKKEGMVVVSGQKIVRELIKSRNDIIRAIVVPENWSCEDTDILDFIDQMDSKRQLLVLKRALFREVDVSGTDYPCLEVCVPEMIPVPETLSGMVVVLPFQDPVNMGSAIRSVLAFGVNSILLTVESCNPFHPKSIRASAGTVFSGTFFHAGKLEDIGKVAENNEMTTIILEMGGDPVSDFLFPENCMIIPGIEGPGVPETLRGARVGIPLAEPVESLNAAIALAITLYEAKIRQSPSNSQR